ncbi:MAG TPA: NADH-quinone oxidoreductase subunit A, partial [Ramlibacter sp.]|nr:NADH-quinone oxidoreductase subunit A [Ramlibacter sp.]
VVLVGLLVFLSPYLGERHASRPAADEPFESGVVSVGDARLRLAAKFYLLAVLFVVFDVEALFVYAWAIALREAGWAGYVDMAIFIAILVAALAWLWRLGALDWGPRRRLTRATEVAP